MNNLTKNVMITLQHIADGKHYEGKPNGLSDAQYIAALDTLESQSMIKVFWQEGHGSYDDIRLLAKGQAALDDLKQEKQKLNMAFGDVSADDKRQHIETMKALVELICEEEYQVLQFLYNTKTDKCDFTNEVPEGMYQPQYEKICDALKEKKLIDIINCDKRGYYVISTIKGDDLVEYIKRNDTKFNYLFQNNNDVETLEESATMNMRVGQAELENMQQAKEITKLKEENAQLKKRVEELEKEDEVVGADILHKGRDNKYVARRITPKEAADIVNGYYLPDMNKTKAMEMLSRLTGIPKTSFQNHVKLKSTPDVE